MFINAAGTGDILTASPIEVAACRKLSSVQRAAPKEGSPADGDRVRDVHRGERAASVEGNAIDRGD